MPVPATTETDEIPVFCRKFDPLEKKKDRITPISEQINIIGSVAAGFLEKDSSIKKPLNIPEISSNNFIFW